MNAAQRRRSRRIGAQPGDRVEWHCRAIGWRRGVVLSNQGADGRFRAVRELEGHTHILRVANINILERFVP